MFIVPPTSINARPRAVEVRPHIPGLWHPSRKPCISSYKGKIGPALNLCQNLIPHFNSRDFTLLTPARTSTLVATAKICIELLDCRIGPDPLVAGRGVRTPRDLLWRGGACFLGWSGVLCSRLADSVPKAYTLHHPVTSTLVPGAG